jgi:hypothetical protein
MFMVKVKPRRSVFEQEFGSLICGWFYQSEYKKPLTFQFPNLQSQPFDGDNFDLFAGFDGLRAFGQLRAP